MGLGQIKVARLYGFPFYSAQLSSSAHVEIRPNISPRFFVWGMSAELRKMRFSPEIMLPVMLQAMGDLPLLLGWIMQNFVPRLSLLYNDYMLSPVFFKLNR